MHKIGLLFLLVGCTAVRRQVHEPPGPLAISGVAVYPVRVMGEEVPAWRTFELNERVISAALADYGDTFAFFGPSEFQVTKWEDDGAWVASNALPLLVRSGVPADRGLVLRVTAEKRVGSQLQERADAKGRARGGSATEEVTWVCTVELLHPSTRLQLVELSAEVTIDPFATPTAEDEFDPAHPMTHLLEKLVKDALEVAAKFPPVPKPSVPTFRVTLAESPAQTAGFPDPTIVKMDALTLEMWMQGRAKFLSPWLDDKQAATLATAGRGLWVVSAPGEAGVQPGDLIIDIDGAIAQRQVLARKRLTVTPVQVKVRRGTAELETTVP